MRDAQGRVASWAQRSWQERPGFGKRASRADAVLGGYSALRFVRGSHERVSQTDCVLPVGEEALPFMRKRFADRQHSDAMPRLGMVASAAFTGHFTCYWDQGANTLDCGGVQCRAGSSLRAVSSAGAMVNADGGSFSGVYTCDNGCTITALVDGSGGWDCGPDEWWSRGNGGGGSGGGGGGGSGGGTQETPCELGYVRELGVCVEDLETVPDGWDAADWAGLTPGEKRLVFSSWENFKKWKARYQQMKDIRAAAWAGSLDIMELQERDDNSQQNAYQHAIWNADMTRAFGFTDAKAWADAHEDLGRPLNVNETRAKNMDLHNNAVGRNAAGSSGPNGSGKADVLLNKQALCWIKGLKASASCG